MTVHQRRTHPEFVDGCYACRVGTVNLAPSARPTTDGGAAAATVNAREKRWDRDMPAYRRLRADGLQPKGIDGSARLERDAETSTEVEMGRTFGPKAQARVHEGVQMSRAMGLVP